MTFSEMMADLQKEYIHGLGEKITEIERLLILKDVDQIREIFHKLKGTGATYGIPEISQLGEAIEVICENQQTETLQQIIEAIQEAVQLVKKIQQTRSAGQTFEIRDNPVFQKIQTLIKN